MVHTSLKRFSLTLNTMQIFFLFGEPLVSQQMRMMWMLIVLFNKWIKMKRTILSVLKGIILLTEAQ